MWIQELFQIFFKIKRWEFLGHLYEKIKTKILMYLIQMMMQYGDEEANQP